VSRLNNIDFYWQKNNKIKMTKILFSLSLILLVSGCKNPLNQYTSQKYYDAGGKAEKQGDYQLAQQSYSRALINSRLGGVDKEMETLSLYELSRVTGYLGDYKKSEKGFLEVIELSKSPESKNLNIPALCELARLYFDTKEYQQSLPIFLEANRKLEALGIEKEDPLGYCLFLEDYKIALEKTGDLEGATKILKKLEEIKIKNPNAKPLFVPKRYTE
jgi:tetratricopeptide (TPR) repeat protein